MDQETTEQDVEKLLQACQAETRKGAFEAAEKLAADAEGRFPDDPRCAQLLPRIRIQQGELDAALEVCNRARDRFPDDLGLALQHSDISRRLRNFDAVIETLHPFLLTHPQDPRLCHALGVAFLVKNEPAKSAAFARMAIGLGLKSANIYRLLGRALFQIEEHKEAVEALRLAIADDAEDFESTAVLSAALSNLSDTKGARAAAERALSLRPYTVRGRDDAPVKALVVEFFRPSFYANRQRPGVYSQFNYLNYLEDADFKFYHMPCDGISLSRVLEEGEKFDVICNNIAVPEAVDQRFLTLFELLRDLPMTRGAPEINPPETVRDYTRLANSRRYREVEEFIFPKTILFDRVRANPKQIEEVIRRELGFPVIIRPIATNLGKGVELAKNIDEVMSVIRKPTYRMFYAIEYHECRDAEGVSRQYRGVVIDGELHFDRANAHADWQTHGDYRATTEWHSMGFAEQEQAFLADPAGVLGFDPQQVFRPILEQTKLDVYGFDFGVTREGRPIVFEVNSAMNLFNVLYQWNCKYLDPHYKVLNEKVIAYLRRRMELAKAA